MRTKFTPFLILPFFFCLTAALHAPGFHSRMIYDSVGFIQEFDYVYASRDLSAVVGLEPARPLSMVTLYVNYLFSGMSTVGFRLFNAFVLACASFALTWLCVVLLELPGINIPGTSREKRFIALFCGLCFLVHPLQGLTVLYIWQREAMLACLFYFSALAVYLAGRSGQWMRPTVAYPLTSLLFLAGMLSKENSVTLPVILAVAEIILLRGVPTPGKDATSYREGSHESQNSSGGFRELIKRILIIGAITIPPFLIAIALSQALHEPDAFHPRGVLARLMSYYETGGITFVEVALTQCRLAFWYLYTILVPWGSGVDLIAPCVISRSLWNPPATVAGLAGVIFLVALALVIMRSHTVPAFGIFFFLIVLAPESLFIPQYLFCGYRAVLPMAGVLFVAATVAARAITARAGTWRPGVATLLGAVIVCLAAMTVVQARKWSPLQVWEHAYDRLPVFSEHVEATPYMDILGSYGLELKNAGDYAGSVDVLNRLIAIDSSPNQFKKTMALVNKGLALIKQGDRAGAFVALRAAHQSDPQDYWACFQLAQALLDGGSKEEGREMLKKTIELNPRYLPARLRLAHLMRESGQLPEAVELFQEAARANPQSGSIQNALGAVLEASGENPLALEAYRNAVRWDPRSATYHFNAARLLAQTGKVPEAIEQYQKAVLLNEAFGPAQANLGTLLLNAGKTEEAVVHLLKASALIPANPNLHVQAAIALMSLGRKAEAREHLEKALALNPDHKLAREHLDRLLTDENFR